ncbi:GDSL-type esterase/lipase family protein [Nonomuraea sp. SYSU D8015]|uniref:GDSL-type esterase/lipase family protein n=1 Tax=Nonomuraea sp. SYSU D8015 TaxID=2593644 RepID=UPI0016605043|nr:GDSL-type esterase/lipase family protein [Nonomuraea sp. SYSU D8015]
MTGAALEPGSNRMLTFGGRPDVTVASGGTALSDPLLGQVAPLRRLAVSLWLRGECAAPTGRNRATTPADRSRPSTPAAAHRSQPTMPTAAAYRSRPGDHAADETGAPFTEPVATWHWLDALIVTASVPGVAVLGDSITTGVGAETGHGWPDLLAHRAHLESWPLAVANEGVSGGRVLTPGTGRHAEERLAAEVLTKPGIDAVLLLAGINDIGAGDRPDALVAAYRRMIGRAHAAGARVIGGTLPPFAGAEYFTAAGERTRAAVNAFIRHGGAFDGVADFDAALRDPAAPVRLHAAYDSGDHLHPSASGHHAMAAAVESHRCGSLR